MYGHQELWLYSGMTDATPKADDVINAKHSWKSPKILKRNESIVAERIDNSDSNWLVTTKPLSRHCAPPWQSCQIDDYFKGAYILIEGTYK
ncbi:hypothetical protein [Enterobacter bugandensis]|uniref:hypothetical protein n=1 Tax=Enterobacter bugandensis TaxID=881260 RepID=UPI0020758752|nr:hypothetical protein [Enterobacter bugandensis]MCM7239258.1 hypothetical protein [Enterobacter bugandensis]